MRLTSTERNPNMHHTLLCLDGPLNGTYSTPENAARHGYMVDCWSTGEEVLVQAKLDAEPDFEAYDAGVAA